MAAEYGKHAIPTLSIDRVERCRPGGAVTQSVNGPLLKGQ